MQSIFAVLQMHKNRRNCTNLAFPAQFTTGRGHRIIGANKDEGKCMCGTERDVRT